MIRVPLRASEAPLLRDLDTPEFHHVIVRLLAVHLESNASARRHAIRYATQRSSPPRIADGFCLS
jgi:hypothetical protein